MLQLFFSLHTLRIHLYYLLKYAWGTQQRLLRLFTTHITTQICLGLVQVLHA